MKTQAKATQNDHAVKVTSFMASGVAHVSPCQPQGLFETSCSFTCPTLGKVNVVRRAPSLGMPIRHAAWPAHGRLQVPKQSACLRDLLGKCLNHPRQPWIVFRAKPHVRWANEHNNGSGKTLANGANQTSHVLGVPLGLFGACHPRNSISAKLKHNHGGGVRGRQPIPFVIGKPSQRRSGCPPHGQVVHHDSLQGSEEHATQSVLGESQGVFGCHDVVFLHPGRMCDGPNLPQCPARDGLFSSCCFDAPCCLRGNAIHREKWQFERGGVSSSAKTRLAQEVPRIRRSNVSMRRRHHGHCPAWPVPSPARLPRFPELTGDSIPLNLAVSPMVDFDGFSIGFGQFKKKAPQCKPRCRLPQKGRSGSGIKAV